MTGGVFPKFTFEFCSIGEALLEYILCYSIRDGFCIWMTLNVFQSHFEVYLYVVKQIVVLVIDC